MKATELIHALAQAVAEHGDMEVGLTSELGFGCRTVTSIAVREAARSDHWEDRDELALASKFIAIS